MIPDTRVSDEISVADLPYLEDGMTQRRSDEDRCFEEGGNQHDRRRE
jgi:hypothetical protein